jgi:hypothetical protein
MRFVLSAIIVAGAIISGSATSQAQVCTSKGVNKGYTITDSNGRKEICCRNTRGPGVCNLKTCKIGITSKFPSHYIYSRTFAWSICDLNRFHNP